jgi:hypothetical protein
MSFNAGGMISGSCRIFILGNIPELSCKNSEESESIFWGHAVLQ